MSVIVKTRENGSRRVQFQCDGESRTEQCHRDKVNINKIMARFDKTRMLPISERSPLMGDFSRVTDFHEAKGKVMQAELEFMMLPADIRSEFGNDPGELADFISRPENAGACIEMGLFPDPMKERGSAQIVAPAGPEGPVAGPETPVEPSGDGPAAASE